MKKVFSLLVAFVVMATSLWVSVSIASAAGSVVVLHVPGVTQQQLKDATLFADSEYQHVNCVLKDAETGKVVCHVPGKFAGEDVQIFLAGQVFSVNVSAERTGGNGGSEETLTCEEGQVPGADVEFTYTGSSNTATWFVSGATLEEVSNNASSYLGTKFESFEIVSELYCDYQY